MRVELALEILPENRKFFVEIILTRGGPSEVSGSKIRPKGLDRVVLRLEQ
jgi:hypothetical protein